ncbi:M15 family metallopeptidase [Fusobacterium pseudoperiodonticum]|uniref:M15 family metallopeptidase n=1 Tax=Fusobacterium pseudoperiodonticum TaxID=2663009 RepID=UPI0028D17BFE|nr:M15 family metallopeptidase [Fusobacterium pseudoperiodonticum]
MYTLSETSLKMLKGVHPNLVNFMTELIKISPWNFKITAGVRTAEEQNRLYQKGRTAPGTKVTNVDGYKLKSNHQVKFNGLGYATDIGVLVKEKVKVSVMENGKKVEKVIEKDVYKGTRKDFHYYQDIYNAAKNVGLLEKYGIEWGGNCWRTFKDAPHWQIKGAGRVAYK